MSWRIAVAVLLLQAGLGVSHARADDLHGSWEAETYRLKSGQDHPVRGLIFFSDGNWTVLFFVLDEHGKAARASGEGGTYHAGAGRLEFTHQFHFSRGEALPGLPESPLRMEIRQASDAEKEACRYSIQGRRLTLHFPSGNSMEFRRGG